ncbi:hypothetical protein ACG94M_04100 [Acinetobacter guillouiae]|uniref:hypothetical protein n=1 Tax=Acinetobacter guillouiae TaxID=106649 RepID=UPI003AF8F06D
MKTNVIFAWPVLTTIFTAFLYWSGFWYYLGYTEFYNYKIEVFDLPVASMLIAGLTKNVNHVLILLTILIFISFAYSVNKEQWKYVSLSAFSILISLFAFIYYLIKPLLKLLPSVNVATFVNRYTPNWLIVFKRSLRKPARSLILSGHRTKRFLKRNELTEPDIRRKSFVTSTPAYSFSFSVYFHYFGMLFLVVCLFFLFKSASNSGESAMKEAEKDFSNFNKMAKVQIKGLPVDELRNTGICFKGLCLITDKYKNAQLYEMKEVKIINKID